VTDAACDQAHEDLAGARLGEVDLLHRERRAELLENRSPHPHVQHVLLCRRAVWRRGAG
jgi:hypothetical protein